MSTLTSTDASNISNIHFVYKIWIYFSEIMKIVVKVVTHMSLEKWSFRFTVECYGYRSFKENRKKKKRKKKATTNGLQ